MFTALFLFPQFQDDLIALIQVGVLIDHLVGIGSRVPNTLAGSKRINEGGT
jgi:hypothetical protein